MISPGKGKPWGKITWYFIHTFCERINPQFFMDRKSECFALLSNVCSMIPCPTCRHHALQYLKNNPLNRIVRNKDDLKAYFYRFHNQATLNGNPMARAADVSVIDMYKKANFKRIIDAFRTEYMKNTPTRQDYTQTLHAQKILKNVLSFLNANQRQFVVAAPAPVVAPELVVVAAEPIVVATEPVVVATESENITFSVSNE
jgi:hypothetical protein